MRFQALWIPDGVAGTRTTLERMRGLVQDALRDPDFLRWARSIVGPPPDQLLRLREWFARSFVYQPDPTQLPTGVPVDDFLLDPQLERARVANGLPATGDCDDATMLACALAGSVGIPCAFRAVGLAQDRGGFSHVYAVLRVDGRDTMFDPTHPLDAPVPAPVRVMEVPV